MLGPILFLIYINDIFNSSSKLPFFLFANDTTVMYTGKNLKSFKATMNSKLGKVSDWLNANKLTWNIKKTIFVSFHPYQRKINHSVNIKIIDDSIQEFIPLECKTRVKFLWVLLDSNLNWKFHIDNIALKMSKIVGVIAY